MPQHVPSARTEEKIARAIELLRQYPIHGMRKRILMEEYQIKWRQAERMLAHARERIRATITDNKEELRGYCYNVLQEIATDPRSKPADKVKAISAMTDLLGLNAPVLIAPVTPDGQHSWNPDQTEQLKARLFDRIMELKGERPALASPARSSQIIDTRIIDIEPVKVAKVQAPKPAPQPAEEQSLEDMIAELERDGRT